MLVYAATLFVVFVAVILALLVLAVVKIAAAGYWTRVLDLLRPHRPRGWDGADDPMPGWDDDPRARRRAMGPDPLIDPRADEDRPRGDS